MNDDRARQDRAAYLRGEPLTDESARREVAWVARQARGLSGTSALDDLPLFVEFYDRKARLLDYIGEPDLAETARRMVDEYRPAPLVPVAPTVEERTEAQLLSELLGGRAKCDECGEHVPPGSECPECLAESLVIVHDGCCDEGP